VNTLWAHDVIVLVYSAAVMIDISFTNIRLH